MQRHEPADRELIGRDSLFVEDLTSFLDNSLVDPQPIKLTPASRGPNSAGGGTAASMPATLRIRFSIMARRLTGLVNSSLIKTPSSMCSSVATVWVCPRTPGTARGEIPLSVIL